MVAFFYLFYDEWLLQQNYPENDREYEVFFSGWAYTAYKNIHRTRKCNQFEATGIIDPLLAMFIFTPFLLYARINGSGK